MRRIRLTPAARKDLSSIWDFTEERRGHEQSEIYLSELRAAIERIAVDPRRGQTCDDVRRGYRRYGIGSHHIFYVVGSDSVDVIRILHQRMDLTRHL